MLLQQKISTNWTGLSEPWAIIPGLRAARSQECPAGPGWLVTVRRVTGTKVEEEKPHVTLDLRDAAALREV